MTELDTAEDVIEGEVIEEARSLPAVRAAEAMIARGEVTPTEVVAQRDKIREVMGAVMQEGIHFGKIPGVSKPTLLKPGAEILAVTFRLAPHYKSERVFHDEGHLTVFSKASLTHIPTGLVIAEGEGLCTTREKKYAYRGDGRVCPACGAGAIKKSKFPPRENDYPGANPSDPPGWYCHAKVGGCGANFAAEDPAIIGQETGKTANPDLPDTWNTVLKMANKRALVAAILNGTAASDIFTQDVEDQPVAADAEPSAATSQPSGQTNQRSNGNEETPRSFAEINALAEPYGAALGWKVWVADCAEKLFNVKDAATLTAQQKATLGQKAAGAVLALRDAVEPDRMPPPNREEIQKAWMKVLNGAILAGPQWRLGPEEAGLPTFEEFHGLPEKVLVESAPATELTPEEQAEVEEIPFGAEYESPYP